MRTLEVEPRGRTEDAELILGAAVSIPIKMLISNICIYRAWIRHGAAELWSGWEVGILVLDLGLVSLQVIQIPLLDFHVHRWRCWAWTVAAVSAVVLNRGSRQERLRGTGQICGPELSRSMFKLFGESTSR